MIFTRKQYDYSDRWRHAESAKQNNTSWTFIKKNNLSKITWKCQISTFFQVSYYIVSQGSQPGLLVYVNQHTCQNIPQNVIFTK